MKKPWKITILVSFIITVVVLVTGVILLYPDYKMYRFFNSIDKGDWSVTREYYDDLSPSQQSDAASYLNGYSITLCDMYATGERSYLETAASFDAINSLDFAKELYSDCMADINKNEFKSAVNAWYRANTSYNADGAVKAQSRLTAVQKRMDTNTKEQILVEMLNEKYQEYLDCKIDAGKLKEFITVVGGISYYQAHNYSVVIDNNLNCVEYYRGLYSEIELAMEEERFSEALAMFDNIYAGLDPADTIYKAKFDEQYQEVYDESKEYYEEKLNLLIAASNGEEAVALMKEIEELYGDDFDLESAKSELAADWQKTYMDIAMNYEAILLTEMSKSDSGEYIFKNEYNRLRPDSMVLYDIDKNGVAEMFLFNSEEVTDEYTECFAFTYANNQYVYLGYVNVLSFCLDSNIIALPEVFGRDYTEEHVLLNFTGTSLTQVSYTRKDGDNYYINEAEATDAEFLSAQTDILDHSKELRICNMDYVDISDYESYILAY